VTVDDRPFDEQFIAELRMDCQWGLLVVADDASVEKIPQWASDGDQITSAASSLVARVLHADDGIVTVRVWRGYGASSGTTEYVRDLTVSSGRLRISDVSRVNSLIVRVIPGVHTIRLHADAPTEPSRIDVVLDPID
jgi:hypothetical protein